mmetsp:Transcript_93592/g.162090  ORF Transcript_93592/g.162090 Transcript_93592/m.162090 type:complete len:81 (-) Transcript_93592:511-753(-)
MGPSFASPHTPFYPPRKKRNPPPPLPSSPEVSTTDVLRPILRSHDPPTVQSIVQVLDGPALHAEIPWGMEAHTEALNDPN